MLDLLILYFNILFLLDYIFL